MPAIPRQLFGEISEALQSRISTASVALLGPTSEPVQATTTSQSPLLPSIPVVPGLTSVVNSLTQIATTSIQVVSTTSVTPVTTTSAAPTTTSAPSTALVATSSSQILSTSTPVTSAVLSLTTPEAPDVVTSTSAVVVTRSATSATATGTGLPSNAGSSTQDNGMSGGIIALIVVGALLAALLAGAFAFRRVQVYRRAKRREDNYGAAIPDNAPFPFTNVSESDLKGAQPIRDPVVSYNEKPLPSIVPDVYPAPPNPTYNQYGQYGDSGMSGPYPSMGGAAMGYGYGYGQAGRASPAPSQVQTLRVTSPSPPPVAYAPGPDAYPNPFPKAPTPAPAPTSAPSIPAASRLAVPHAAPQVGGKKRVIQTFQPTLPDELDIREGDWVTVVHAYDDGWGLCECNGRRGVVPLECLDPGRPDFRASRRFSSLSAIRQ